MLDVYKEVVFYNYANFYGRARRSEFWYFNLIHILAIISLVLLGAFFEDGSVMNSLSIGLFVLYILATFIPSLAVTVRRLHDVNISGWFYLVTIIPYVGSLVLLIIACIKGTVGENNYGSDPKKTLDEIDEIGQSENI